MSKFKKTVTFEPGFDYIVNGPPSKEKYGRHGMNMRFILRGKKGAVSFTLFTGMMPVIKDSISSLWRPTFRSDIPPMATDISYHSHVPMYEGQDKRDKCPWLDDKPCYSGGSTLYAEEFMAAFLNDGEDALWDKMKEYYKDNL